MDLSRDNAPRSRAKASLEHQIVKLAQTWRRGDGVSQKVAGAADLLLDDPRFDAALRNSCGRLTGALGHDASNAFLVWLRDRAGFVLSETRGSGGRSVTLLNQLFVVSVAGAVPDGDEVVRERRAAEAMMRLFHDPRVIAPGESVRITKLAMDSVDLAIAQPGEIRALVRHGMSTDPDDKENSEKILGLIQRRSINLSLLGHGRKAWQRAFIGVSTTAVSTEDNLPLIPPNRFAMWAESVNQCIDVENLVVQQPASWNQAIEIMTISQIQRCFEIDAVRKRHSSHKVEGKILHVAAHPSGVLFMALERDHDILGPIRIPTILLASSGEIVNRSLRNIALEIQEYDDVSELPRGVAMLHS